MDMSVCITKQATDNSPASRLGTAQISGLPPVDMDRGIQGLLNPAEVAETVDLTLDTLHGVMGDDPLQMMVSTIRGKFGALDLPGWVKLLATAQKHVADIHPGKWTRWAEGRQAITMGLWE